MKVMSYFRFHTLHLQLIDHWSLIIVNSLEIENCKLKIEPTLGGV